MKKYIVIAIAACVALAACTKNEVKPVAVDQEITFALSGSQDFHHVTLYTYRFDEAGNLTEIIRTIRDALWNGYTTHYYLTDTPESEMKAWVEQVKAAQS